MWKTNVEATPSGKNKRKTVAFERKMAYKYPKGRKVLADLTTTHTPGELRDLLNAGIDFPDLGMFKIEADHPVPGLDNLVTI